MRVPEALTELWRFCREGQRNTCWQVLDYNHLSWNDMCVAGLQGMQPLEWAYSQPNINWSLSDRNAAIAPPGIVEGSGDSWAYYNMVNADLLGEESEAVSSTPLTPLHEEPACVWLFRGYPQWSIDAAEEATCEWTKESTWYGALQRLRMFEDEPLSSLSLGGGKETVFMAMNRGISVRLFRNPHHKAQVTPAQLQHGLQPEGLHCLMPRRSPSACYTLHCKPVSLVLELSSDLQFALLNVAMVARSTAAVLLALCLLL